MIIKRRIYGMAVTLTLKKIRDYDGYALYQVYKHDGR